MSMPTPEEFLDKAKVHSFSFKGDPVKRVSGTVISTDMMQQIDFESKILKWWGADSKPLVAPVDPNTGQPPAGARPMWQLAVRLQTSLRNGEGTARPHEVVDDDGVRGVYLSGNKLKAVQAAFQAKGLKMRLEPGDELSLEFFGEDFAAQRGNLNAPKLFRAEVTKGAGQQADVWNQAAPAASADPWSTSAAPAAAAPVAAAPAAQAAIPDAQLAQLPDATIQMLKDAGTISKDWQRPA